MEIQRDPSDTELQLKIITLKKKRFFWDSHHQKSNTPDGTFSKSAMFISHIHLLKSPLKAFVKGRQNLEGKWTNPFTQQSRPIRFFLLVEPVNYSSRLPISGRLDLLCPLASRDVPELRTSPHYGGSDPSMLDPKVQSIWQVWTQACRTQARFTIRVPFEKVFSDTVPGRRWTVSRRVSRLLFMIFHLHV